MQRRLDGDRQSSPAVAAVIIRIAIIKLMAILRIKNNYNINSASRYCWNGLWWLQRLPGMLP